MITRKEERQFCQASRLLIEQSGLVFTDQEYDSMVSADFGLSRLAREGLQVLTFLNTDKIGAKAITLLPGQTMLEHWHPKRANDPGKEETLRCIYGVCRLYLPGDDTLNEGYIPEGQDEYYTCRNEIILQKTDQYTIAPGIPHWFQPGEAGCVVLSFSSNVTDLEDRFTNPNVVRQTQYGDESG